MNTLEKAAQPGRSKRSGQGGFSLTEMLVVLVIMGLILGLVGPRVLRYLSSAKSKTAALQIENLRSTMSLYFIEEGRYPTQTEGLAALGPYLEDGDVPTDPWGNAYLYKIPGEGDAPYQITSLGADGAPGGDGENADIMK